MDIKAVFFFLFFFQSIYAFSVTIQPFPPLIAGQTYNSSITINSVGSFDAVFRLYLTGVNASNEIKFNITDAKCAYSVGIWECNYSQSGAGTYTPQYYLSINELLDTSQAYSYRLEYEATEETPNTASTSSQSHYSSTGGTSFAPRPKPVKPPSVAFRNDTKPPEIKPKPPSPVPVITPPIKQEEPPILINETPIQNETQIWPIQQIEPIEPTMQEPKEDYTLPAIGVGLLVVVLILLCLYVFVIKPRMEMR